MQPSPENKPTLTLSQLRSGTEKAKKAAAIDYTHPLLRGLSVLARYDNDMLGSITRNLEISEDAPIRDHADKISAPITVAGKTWYCLKDLERKKILSLFESADEIETLVKQYQDYMDPDNPIQQAFNAHVLETDLPLEEQTMPQLLATYTVIDWLRETPIQTRYAEDVLRRIKQLELLQPFKRLTSNFSGRQTELAALSDYVDWLPKSNVGAALSYLLRSITSLKERPPLMITGIGGIGKSTLIAKFILQQLETRKEGRLPFVYFDFDKSGLSIENLNGLAYDAMTQLAYQFPDYASTFNGIADTLKDSYFDFYAENSSRGSDRSYFFESFIEQHAAHLNALKLPILIVFDSFEEVQTRYPRTTLFNLFEFLNVLSERLPRLRIVFVSRSDFKMSNTAFQTYPMPAFDKASAIAYLDKLKIVDPVFAGSIYDQFGGNPLTLQLAAGLLEKEGYTDKKTLAKINTGSLFSKITDVQVQEQLVQRNLLHIKNEKVRRIAIPGILVRRIDADVIRHVLAIPCGLGTITKKEANDLYTELQKEAFLLNDNGSFITFRQDLRIALAPLIEKDPSYQSKQIHEAAMAYYFPQKASPESFAEFLYHSLMNNGDPRMLESVYNKKIEPYLSNSFSELPIDAYVYLAAIAELNVPEDKLSKASPFAWERYMIAQIEICLRIGDEGALQDIAGLLQIRKIERTPHFLLWEAKLNERLGDFKTTDELLIRSQFSPDPIPLEETDDHLDWLRFILVQSASYEYQSRFGEALFVIDRILSRLFDYIQTQHALNRFDIEDLGIAILFKAIRLHGRIGSPALGALDTLRQLLALRFESPDLHHFTGLAGPLPADEPDLIRLAKILSQPYEAAFLRLARNNGIRSVNDFLDGLLPGLVPDKYFQLRLDVLRSFRSKSGAGDKIALEAYLVENYNVYLKDICEPGTYEVNLVDVVLFEEATSRPVA